MAKVNLKVKGMHCKSCEMLIKDVLEDAGAKDVVVSHKSAELSMDSDLPAEKVRKLLQAEGYDLE